MDCWETQELKKEVDVLEKKNKTLPEPFREGSMTVAIREQGRRGKVQQFHGEKGWDRSKKIGKVGGSPQKVWLKEKNL